MLDEGKYKFKLTSSLNHRPENRIFKLTIFNRQNFEIAISQVGMGSSFRLTARSITNLRSSGALAYIGYINEENVSTYVQSFTEISLQKISNILLESRCWDYSVAVDAGSKHGDSFIDVRCRFFNGCAIENVHLLEIPLREKCSGENMFNVVCRLLEAVVGEDWIRKLLGISTDGAASMVGCISGPVTRLERIAQPGVYRNGCGAHQLDLVVQEAFDVSLKSEFHSVLHTFISFLRRQTNFKSLLGSVCPKEATTRWLSMGLVCNWIIRHRHEIQSYCNDNHPSKLPANSWWFLLYLVNDIMRSTNICFKSLQGKDTLLQTQNENLQRYISNVKSRTGIYYLESNIDLLSAAVDGDIIDKEEKYVTKLTHFVSFIETVGCYPLSIYDNMNIEQRKLVLRQFSAFLTRLCSNIDNLMVIRDTRNAPRYCRSPLVFPSELKNLSPREFYALVSDQKERLLHTHTPRLIEKIEEEFRFLKGTQIRSENTITGEAFMEYWDSLGPRFRTLRRFCGGLASVFPTTATVESDFSLINFELDDKCRNLSMMSLAGIMHSKQWPCVKKLSLVE